MFGFKFFSLWLMWITKWVGLWDLGSIWVMQDLFFGEALCKHRGVKLIMTL